MLSAEVLLSARRFGRCAPVLAAIACAEPAPPPPREPERLPAADAAPASTEIPDASVAAVQEDAAVPALPPEERCDSAAGVGGPRAWPEVPGRELAARRGGANVRAKLVALTPGYDCGGAPVGCPKLSPFTAEVAAEDGTRITLRASESERGERLALGRDHLFSLVWCAASDAGGGGYAALRGASIFDRVAGASAGCSMEASTSKPAAKLEAWAEHPLGELSRKSVLPGGFNTVGFVTDRFVPRPCPKNAVCKPQPPAHLVLSDRASSPAHSLVLLTPEPMKIAAGGPYRASVALCGSSTYGGSNEGTLVAIARMTP